MANHIYQLICIMVFATSLNQVAADGWKFEEPITFLDEDKTFSTDMKCDDELIVSGQKGWSGEARVYAIATKKLKYVLQCNKLQDTPAPFSYDNIQVSLGKNVIGTFSGNDGTVSIWDRNDGNLLYQEKHHGKGVRLGGIEVMDDCVITGAEDGSLIFVEKIAGEWEISHKSKENRDSITHIAADENWLVTGHKRNIKLWNLAERKLVKTFDIEDGAIRENKDWIIRKSIKKLVGMINPAPVNPVWMVTLNYPYAFAVGGSYWNGVKVWDMEKGVQIRHILKDEKGYESIHSNGQLLTFGEYVTSWMSGRDDGRMLKLGVYDIKQLADPGIMNENLWSKSFQYSGSISSKRFRAATNNNNLIVDHGRKQIDIIKFEKENEI